MDAVKAWRMYSLNWYRISCEKGLRERFQRNMISNIGWDKVTWLKNGKGKIMQYLQQSIMMRVKSNWDESVDL